MLASADARHAAVARRTGAIIGWQSAARSKTPPAIASSSSTATPAMRSTAITTSRRLRPRRRTDVEVLLRISRLRARPGELGEVFNDAAHAHQSTRHRRCAADYVLANGGSGPACVLARRANRSASRACVWSRLRAARGRGGASLPVPARVLILRDRWDNAPRSLAITPARRPSRRRGRDHPGRKGASSSMASPAKTPRGSSRREPQRPDYGLPQNSFWQEA